MTCTIVPDALPPLFSKLFPATKVPPVSASVIIILLPVATIISLVPGVSSEKSLIFPKVLNASALPST